MSRYMTQLGLILCCLIGNMQVGILFDPKSYFLPGIGLGLLATQMSLIGLWGGLGPGLWMTRIPWTLCLTAGIFFAVVIGYQLGHPPLSLEMLVLIFQVLLMATLVSQIPFLLLGRFGKWALIPPTRNEDDSRQLSIRSLLLSTTVLALTVALAQRQFPNVKPQALLQWDPVDSLSLMMVPLVSFLSQLVVGPFLIAYFRTRPFLWREILFGLIACLVGLSALTLVEYEILKAAFGTAYAHRQFLVVCIVFNGTHLFFSALAADILKQDGFRMS